jgi:hypothetical protein
MDHAAVEKGCPIARYTVALQSPAAYLGKTVFSIRLRFAEEYRGVRRYCCMKQTEVAGAC